MNKKTEKVILTDDLKKKCKLLSLASDPTRMRIICYMLKKKEACVSEISEALDMSLASISHHLQIMKENNIFDTKRNKNRICYILKPSFYIKNLSKFICHPLN